MRPGPQLGFYTAAAAIAPYLRVKEHATAGKVEIAGDEASIGVALIRSYADGDPMTVHDNRESGTITYIANGAIAAGAKVSSAAAGKVQTGTGGVQLIGTAITATTSDGEQIEVKPETALGGTTSRANISQQDLMRYDLPLEDWRVTGTGALLGATAGTPANAFGITAGTHGTNSIKLVGEAASGNTKTNRARLTFTLPPEYVSGETITARVRAKEAVGAATVSTTIDVEAHKEDGDGAVGADICATAAQDVTTTVGDKDFTITPTGLVAGDKLDIELTGVTNDTGGTIGTVLELYRVSLLLDIKG